MDGGRVFAVYNGTGPVSTIAAESAAPMILFLTFPLATIFHCLLV